MIIYLFDIFIDEIRQNIIFWEIFLKTKIWLFFQSFIVTLIFIFFIQKKTLRNSLQNTCIQKNLYCIFKKISQKTNLEK